jgi:signal transduction histidine kinase
MLRTDRRAARAERTEERRRGRSEEARRLSLGLAHHLNNRLTVVLTSAALLAQQAWHDEDAAASLAMMRESAERIAQLVTRLMRYGGARRQDATTALNPEIRRFVADLALPDGVALGVALDPLDGLVPLSGEAIRAVLTELVRNAREAQPAGGAIAIETVRRAAGAARAVEGGGSWLELAVRDEGPGIPAEIAPNLFDPFCTTKAPDGSNGYGLGLATVRTIAEGCGGFARARSAPGHGTTISVFLPLVGAEVGEPAA